MNQFIVSVKRSVVCSSITYFCKKLYADSRSHQYFNMSICFFVHPIFMKSLILEERHIEKFTYSTKGNCMKYTKRNFSWQLIPELLIDLYLHYDNDHRLCWKLWVCSNFCGRSRVIACNQQPRSLEKFANEINIQSEVKL